MPFSPASINDLVYWYRAGAENYTDQALTTAATADGALVGSVRDLGPLGGAGANLTSGGSSFRPTLRTGVNGLNGYPIWSFNASSLNFLVTGVTPIALTVLTDNGTGTATGTTAAAHSLVVGDAITIAGCTPTNYNIVTRVLTVPLTTTFTYAMLGTGPNTVLGTVARTQQAIPHPHTRFLVVRSRAATAAIFCDGITATNLSQIGQTVAVFTAASGATLTTDKAIDTNWHIIAVVYSGNGSEMYIDNVLSGGNLGAHVCTGLRLGANFGNGSAANCEIAECFGFLGALGPFQISLVTEALASRYGLTVAKVPYSFYDDFNRADNTILGRSPSGHLWAETGAALLKIESGRLVCQNAETGYGYGLINLAAPPVVMGGMLSWTDDGDIVPSGGTLIAMTDKAFTIAHAVHCFATNTGWTIQVVSFSGSFVNLAQGTYATPCLLDGTAYEVRMTISGDTVTLLTPDGASNSVTDVRIGAVHGRFCIWEVDDHPDRPSSRWDSVYATCLPPDGEGTYSPSKIVLIDGELARVKDKIGIRL